ncbi:trehalose-phosphatase [Polyangium spumosum]|uniref:Trehalose 6-phosphate phosphatase n=1 Tax=Polyangium spumosum TaxID=889282 RepID=A0A6N7Q0S3_9BACT|nr:trehalose-phosphatase [Polyangium spumosum]MRG96776.1 trehalose-phosphatase [Polyangium spumosum]
MDEHALVARIARATSLLVATDFDGTIADITTEPDGARARADALSALSALAALPGVHLAVVSGRDMKSLHERTRALVSVYRVAEHGAFLEAPDGTQLGAAHVAPARVLDELVRLAEAHHARVPGMRVERKTSSVAVHVREVEPDARAAAVEMLAAFRRAARAAELVVIDGRQVVEARDPRASKETALAFVLSRLPEGTFVVYAGDDTTDEGAIALARQRGGAGIYVASAERPTPNVEADLVLPGPPAWAELLERIARARSS